MPLPATAAPSLPPFMQGEPSVFEREMAGRAGQRAPMKNKLLIAGRDYEHQDFCQVSAVHPLLHCLPPRVYPAGCAWALPQHGSPRRRQLTRRSRPPRVPCRFAGTAATWCAAISAQQHTMPSAWACPPPRWPAPSAGPALITAAPCAHASRRRGALRWLWGAGWR